MLTVEQIKEYASKRGLSLRDIEAYCGKTAGHIGQILNGQRPLNEENHREIINGINAAYAAKKDGTFKRPALDKNKNAVKEREGTTEPQRGQKK